MENTLQMEEGKIYYVRINEIQDGNKDIPTQKYGMTHKWYILGQNKQMQDFKAEFLCPKDLHVELEFPVGIYRYVKCVTVSKLGTFTISPTEEPGAPVSSLKTAQQLVSDTLKGKGHNAANCYAVSITGSSICFSTSYAKDLLVAEISLKPEGYQITDEDVERMMGWSFAINDAICERINFDK